MGCLDGYPGVGGRWRVMEDVCVGLAAREPEDLAGEQTSLVRRGVPIPNPPIVMNVPKAAMPGELKLAEAGGSNAEMGGAAVAGGGGGKNAAVLHGLKDLQQLQKQTIAVLEAVKGNLEDIQKVLRSPEATRGMEKQQNAAALLARGFSGEAVQQAAGAAELLPVNPDAHLLLSLALASDQQFDASLAAARKGLALFDRRQHPLAIEAGLLHAIAALGHGPEAAERWGQIVEGLPLAVLMEHLARIAVCYPSDAPEGQLDGMIERRVARGEGLEARGAGMPRRALLAADDVPAGAIFAGLDAAREHKLLRAHKAILELVKQKAVALGDAAEVVRFLGEFVVPLGNRGLERTAASAAKRCGWKLFAAHADAMTLHRAMNKMEMAGCETATHDLAALLEHWRCAGQKQARARGVLMSAVALMVGGIGVLSYTLWGMDGLEGKANPVTVAGMTVDMLWFGPLVLAAGAVVGVLGLMGRYPQVELPSNRGPLSGEERAYLRQGAVKVSLRGALRKAVVEEVVEGEDE